MELRDLASDERPTRRALLLPLLAAIAVKDLEIYDVPRSLLSKPGDIRLPWTSLVHGIRYGETADLVAFGALVAVFAAALTLSRVGSALVLLLYAWAFAADQRGYTNNVFLFMTLLALVIVEPRTDPSAKWPTTVVKGLVTIIYLVGALMKLGSDWTSGFILGEAFEHYHGVYAKVFAVHSPAAFRVMALGSLAVEAFMAFGLWFRRMRRIAFAVGMIFHVAIDLLLPVRIFSYVMIASYVVFFDDEELASITSWWEARGPFARALVVVGAGTGVNFVLGPLLGLQAFPSRNMMALVLSIVVLLGVRIAFPNAKPPGESRVLVPRTLRIPIVALLAVLELFLVTKPLFGFDNRFGWRMFTEVLKLRVSAEALGPDGWTPLAVTPWSADQPSYHWDSLGEERAQLRAWAALHLESDPSLQAVRVTLHYDRNRIEGTETFELTR